MQRLALPLAIPLLAACADLSEIAPQSQLVRQQGAESYRLENGVCVVRDEAGDFDTLNRVPRAFCGL